MSEFLTENNKTAKTFNLFFETVTDSLDLFSWSSKINVRDNKVQGIILNFSNHPITLIIKEKLQLNRRFLFSMFLKSSRIKRLLVKFLLKFLLRE